MGRKVREKSILFSLLFLCIPPAPPSLITAASCYTTSIIHGNNKKIIIIIISGVFVKSKRENKLLSKNFIKQKK